LEEARPLAGFFMPAEAALKHAVMTNGTESGELYRRSCGLFPVFFISQQGDTTWTG
jgi:hypothetical protein